VISQFNWWNRVLQPSTISEMAPCQLNITGNIVAWEKSALEVLGATQIIEVSEKEFCDKSSKLVFFPGRRSRYSAEIVCGAHGGWVVTPTNEEENQRAFHMYREHAHDCVSENTKATGWLGVSFSKSKTYLSKFFVALRETGYQNIWHG
jgi:hypothetical protein